MNEKIGVYFVAVSLAVSSVTTESYATRVKSGIYNSKLMTGAVRLVANNKIIEILAGVMYTAVTQNMSSIHSL